ncbi:3-methyladenine DNA glycosylase [Actinotalea sp. Marseille-Q4924]|uniref:3-methyladenine DNA glycosylase n=1 Tax=Actinotalea sp. Marseille-Q4924 TaxID=2866571 RepID=UPI001CE3C841|nr:3-methyladenine DNA glycosylase [Actinotalea sp. Marseille-Q4924]
MTSPTAPSGPFEPETVATSPAPLTLTPTQWRRHADEHAAHADALTAAHRARRATGEKHPVEDFLYEYYALKPAALRRWHPGAGVRLAPGPDGPAPHAAWRWYTTDDDHAVGLDLDAYLADRAGTVRYVRDLLVATAARPAHLGCLGLHEWAMVYRQDDVGRRHALPLRLGREGTDAVVERHAIRCSHFDAFRFFTPEATGRNALQPTRETQPAMEQPGCLHATMDLLKWSLKLGPLVPGDVLLEAFRLASDVRRLDMQASPYDVSALGEPVVAVETPEGKAEYVRRQRAFSERAAPLRARLADLCGTAVGGDRPAPQPSSPATPVRIGVASQ